MTNSKIDLWNELKQKPELRTGIKRLRAEKSLYNFVRLAWPVVEPGAPLLDNWHIEAICRHLEAVADGRIQRLLVNVPPGHAKSLIVCVFWPAWMWLRRPEWRALFSSYGMDLAIRDSVRCRDLIESDWYQQTFQPAWKLKSDQNVKSHFENDRSGYRVSLSVGGRATGFRGDCIVVDDPLNAKDQYSEAALTEVNRWWDQVMSSRLNDQRTGGRVIIMQRLSSKDLSGHVLDKGGYVHLCLPSEFEAERSAPTAIGWRDPRTEEGELMFKALYTRPVLEQAKKDMGSDAYAAQHQQRPAPAEGARFKAAWFRHYHHEAGTIVLVKAAGQRQVVNPACYRRFLTVDLAASLKTSADYTVIGAWADDGYGNLILLDLVRDRIEQHKIIQEIWRLFREYECLFVGIESVGSQLLFVQAARVQGLPVQELRPDRDKVSRSIPATIRMEAGQVWFPEGAPWLEALRRELLEFPHGSHNDCVDALSMAVLQMLLFYQSGRIYGELVTSAEMPREPQPQVPSLAPESSYVRPDGWTVHPGAVLTASRQTSDTEELTRNISREMDWEDEEYQWWRQG